MLNSNSIQTPKNKSINKVPFNPHYAKKEKKKKCGFLVVMGMEMVQTTVGVEFTKATTIAKSFEHFIFIFNNYQSILLSLQL